MEPKLLTGQNLTWMMGGADHSGRLYSYSLRVHRHWQNCLNPHRDPSLPSFMGFQATSTFLLLSCQSHSIFKAFLKRPFLQLALPDHSGPCSSHSWEPRRCHLWNSAYLSSLLLPVAQGLTSHLNYETHGQSLDIHLSILHSTLYPDGPVLAETAGKPRSGLG